MRDKKEIPVGCLLKNPQTSEKIKWNVGNTKDVKKYTIQKSNLLIVLSVFNADKNLKPLTCSVGDKSSNIKISDCYRPVEYTIKNPDVNILLPPFDENTDASIPLVCYVSDFSPKVVKVVWLKNGKEYSSQLSRFKVLQGEDKLFSGTINLNVSRESWNIGDTYTCKVEMNGSIFMHNISRCSGGFVKPVVNLELPSIEDFMHGNGRVICSVLGTNIDTYKTLLNFDDQNIIATIDSKNSLRVVYSHNVTEDFWKSVKKVSCVAQSFCTIDKAEDIKEVQPLSGSKSPTIQIVASCESGTKETSTLICLVSDFYPHDTSVDWLKNMKTLPDKGKDFAAMWNNKDKKYFGKSEISVKWNENDVYTCKVIHQGQQYLQNITKCSACKNSFERPILDLILPTSEDLRNGNAEIKCLIQVWSLDPNDVSIQLDPKNVKMTGRLNKKDEKDTYTVAYAVTKKELIGINTVKCVVKWPCSSTPVEISKATDKIVEQQFPDILTFTGNSNMTTDTIPLLCIISNYWPQNVDLVWLKNGNKLDKKDSVFTSIKQENGMYSGKSLLTVTIESWNKDTYLCHVTHEKKEWTQAVQKPQVPDGDILKPSFRDLFLYKNATVSCRTNMVHANIQWIVNETPREAQTKKGEIIHNNTTWVQSTMTINLKDWMKISTLSCKMNPPQEHLQKKMTIVRTKNDVKVPTIHLLPPDQEATISDLMLICLVKDFYPEDLFVTWKINDSLTNEDVSNPSQVNCNHNIKRCTAISQLKIQKSEWLKGTTYSCLVAHISSDAYIIKNISGLPNKSEETFFTSEPDVWKLSIDELLHSKNATVTCRTSVGINYINWLSNKTEIPILRQRNDEPMLYKDVESVQVTIQIPLKEWKTSSTQLCNQEFYNTTDLNNIKQPKVYLLSTANEREEEEHLTLICLVDGFYPEDVFVIWRINDTTIKQDFPQLKDVTCDAQKQLCSYISHLPILKKQWLGGMSYECQVAHVSSKYYISSNISKPNDIYTVYEDDGGEDLQELEEINNMWTTTSTFIALFLVTLIYSSFVTFVKVK